MKLSYSHALNLLGIMFFVIFAIYFNNPYPLFVVSSSRNSVTSQNRTQVYMNIFDHKNLVNHILQ